MKIKNPKSNRADRTRDALVAVRSRLFWCLSEGFVTVREWLSARGTFESGNGVETGTRSEKVREFYSLLEERQGEDIQTSASQASSCPGTRRVGDRRPRRQSSRLATRVNVNRTYTLASSHRSPIVVATDPTSSLTHFFFIFSFSSLFCVSISQLKTRGETSYARTIKSMRNTAFGNKKLSLIFVPAGPFALGRKLLREA